MLSGKTRISERSDRRECQVMCAASSASDRWAGRKSEASLPISGESLPKFVNAIVKMVSVPGTADGSRIARRM
jgi:hypothetical protein